MRVLCRRDNDVGTNGLSLSRSRAMNMKTILCYNIHSETRIYWRAMAPGCNFVYENTYFYYYYNFKY